MGYFVHMRHTTGDHPTHESLERRWLFAAPPPPGSELLTGTPIGTAGSYQSRGNTLDKAFDDNPATFFDAPANAVTPWAGLDLGAAKTITQVQFVPRAGFGPRMVGGVFQGSDSADFSTGVDNLYTIKSAPAAGVYTVGSVTDTTPFEFVRYVGPAGAVCNVAELVFAGYSTTVATTSAAAVWTMTPIGTSTRPTAHSIADATTVTAAGADIWNSTDSFGFDYDSMTGNGVVTARVTAQSAPNSAAKGGVMIRESTNTDSRYVLIALTPSGLVMQARTATHSTPTYSVATPAAAGVWVQLRRNGSAFSGYTSTDGRSWTRVGTVSIPMVDDVVAGLAVTSHDDTRNSSATFDNISLASTNTAASVWTDGATAPMNRWEAETFSYDNRLYVFGGFIDRNLDATSECDVYDPATDRWTKLTSTPTGALTHASVAVVGDTAYFAGGDIGTFTYGRTSTSTSQVLTYDLTTNTWGRTTSLPAAMSCGGLVAINSRLYYFGGLSGDDKHDLSTTYSLDLSNPSKGWSAKAAMPDGRNHLGGVTVNGIAYAVGGGHLYNEVSGNDAEVDAYNPATNRWTKVAALPKPWASNETTTIIAGGKIVLIGGQTNGGYDGIYLNAVEAYDPSTNQWSQIATLPEANEGESAAYINGQLIVAGGTVDNLGGWSQDQVWTTSMAI